MSEGLPTAVDEFDEPEVPYRSVDAWAVWGLILGLLSIAALAGGVMWLVALVSVGVNLIALRRIKNDASRSGRGAALMGLGLSVMFAVTPWAQAGANQVVLARQGREVTEQFLEYLRERSPEKALQLRFAPDRRQPIDETLWTYFRNDADSRNALLKFVELPAIRTLLALGPRAEYRFYKTSSVVSDGSRGLAHYYYTVTYPDDPEGDANHKKTFFVSVVAERNRTVKPGVHPWRISNFSAGFDPAAPDLRPKALAR
jgi:hypothetical protein